MRKAVPEPKADFTYRRVVQPLSKPGPFQTRLDGLLNEGEAPPRREKLRVTRIDDPLLREGLDGSYDVAMLQGGGRSDDGTRQMRQPSSR